MSRAPRSAALTLPAALALVTMLTLSVRAAQVAPGDVGASGPAPGESASLQDGAAEEGATTAGQVPDGGAASATDATPSGAVPADDDPALPPAISTEELAAAGLELVLPAGPVPLGWVEVGVRGELGRGAVLELVEPPADLVVGELSDEPLSLGGRSLTLRLGLLRSGPVLLGPWLLVDGARSWSLPEVELEVAAPVAEDAPARVRSLLGPLALPLPRRLLRAFYAGGLLAAVLAGLYVIRATRRVETPRFVEPADQQALEALGRLRQALPRRSDDVPGFVVAVSDVLRRYIEGRFDVHAPSRTTEEFLMEAVGAEGQLAERTATLEQFLTLCDLVKYARHRPAASEAEPLLDTAETFVEETR